MILNRVQQRYTTAPVPAKSREPAEITGATTVTRRGTFPE
jgi:hypothetical protein